MEKQVITKLNRSFDETAYEQNGMEYYLARDIQILLEYDEWRNFSKVIEKAKTACENAGQKEGDHFVDVNKTIPMPKGAEKIVEDFMLTRYACYLIAQNDLHGEAEISSEHVKNNQDIRGVLSKSGIKPENLPPEEDLKKLERRVKTEEKKLGKNSGKLLNTIKS